MSRTFRRDESGRKPRDSRRAKRREKNNSHWKPETHEYDYAHQKFKRNYSDDWDIDN